MARLEFQTLEFTDEKDNVKMIFYRMFYNHIAKEELSKIGKFAVEKNAIVFPELSDKEANNKFGKILLKSFSHLKNVLNNNPTFYIHSNSGIPLFGTLAFGIVDKGSNMLEVKPLTSCNINCNFCSVDEGLSSKKQVDFVIEEEYLAAEIKRLLDYKAHKGIDVYINPHGEPTLYAELEALVRDLRAITWVNLITIITNGVLLTEEYVDRLVAAGLNQVNLSINGIDPKKAKIMAGTGKFDIEHIKAIAAYISKKVPLIIAPVYVQGYNDTEMPSLIEFAKSVNAKIRIQNFLINKQGRNPAEQLEWEEFEGIMKGYEKQFGVKIFEEFKTEKTKEYPAPFKKGEVVDAEIFAPGRFFRDKYAVAQGRIITVPNCDKEGKVKLKITRSLHNVFYGQPLGK